MLTLSIEDLILELEDGAVKHVGPKTTDATVKLYHVAETQARGFGDRQVKLGFEDGEGNEVEIALDTEDAVALGEELTAHGEGTPADDSGRAHDESDPADGSSTGGESPF
jgi:hypothetical protein